MSKSDLTSLAGAAVLLLLSTHVASAGPDGTCEDFGAAETVASEAPAPSTPVAAVDYTKTARIAPAAGNSATIIAKSEAAKKQTESLPKEYRSSDASGASVFDTGSDY